ncbi:Oidioi.mRNA.OKI2018_I69.chrUn_7.g17254.t1.cds [Oikopleura dioica]|uniref:Oidioi.mRNA.OKI2018_I69.PAR.g10060.t1.cds n=1 Tax=Oikopleura dioica TaxID=34765 RepID=A0ABN7T9U2_OIKDI|nr:Oidioi.mRNA.OKI2018_I69.PAR.g10060.t1.cds [Oikopleura dioica]CAG5114439.1 Oidioi.mRNA.OKI2018_I69.chrUn_7.g17254.t1.cds [Oikopleura dioica]
MSAKSSIPPRQASAKPRPVTTSTSASRFGAFAKTGVSKTERKPGATKKEEAKKVVQPTSSKTKPGVIQPKVVSRFGQASSSSKKEVQKVKPASSSVTAPGKSTAATNPKPKIPTSTMEKPEKSKPLTAKAAEVTERLLTFDDELINPTSKKAVFVFEQVVPGLKTNDKCQATFNDVAWEVAGKGFVTSANLTNVQVK